MGNDLLPGPIQTAAEFRAAARLRPPLQFYAAPVLRRGGTMLLFGPTGSWKSVVALDCAWKLASGEPVFNCPNELPPASVLYLDTEAGCEVLSDRLEVLGKSYWATSAERNLHPADVRYTFHFGVRGCDQYLTWLEDTVLTFGIEVVILDSIEPAYVGDENAANEMRPALDGLKAACGEAALILVHHSSKRRDQHGLGSIRGSTALGNWAETVVEFTPNTPTSSTLNFLKVRNGKRPGKLKLRGDATSINHTLTSLENAAGNGRALGIEEVRAGYRALSQSTGQARVPQPDLAHYLRRAHGAEGRTHLSESTVRRAIQAAVKAGLIAIDRRQSPHRVWEP